MRQALLVMAMLAMAACSKTSKSRRRSPRRNASRWSGTSPRSRAYPRPSPISSGCSKTLSATKANYDCVMAAKDMQTIANDCSP
ncbi:MAG: hypothetical protein HOV81_16725 [Kofleriaceae bacterium]|nr:hypothetical protein [Kofleriaceae bacterium]